MDSNKKIELKKLEPIVEKRFKTSKELQKHVEKYKSIYETANNIEKQIEQLEWELMTPEERAKEEEILRLMKLKREGKM